MGFGTEILFVLVLGLLVLGPRRLHTMLGRAAQAKAQFEEASRGFRSQLSAELDAADRDGMIGDSPQLAQGSEPPITSIGDMEINSSSD